MELLTKERLRAENYVELRIRSEGVSRRDWFCVVLSADCFRLSPSASQFESRLYTEILPMLKDEDALVMSLYIRTGFTDRQANKDEKKEGPAPDTMKTGATNSATRRNVKMRIGHWRRSCCRTNWKLWVQERVECQSVLCGWLYPTLPQPRNG